jgi:hypothetical protein
MYTIMNLQTTTGKYSSTYSEDFLKAIFFILSALGTGVAPKELDGVDLPTEGSACPGAAVGAVDSDFRLVEGGTCPGVASIESNDGFTIMEGTL